MQLQLSHIDNLAEHSLNNLTRVVSAAVSYFSRQKFNVPRDKSAMATTISDYAEKANVAVQDLPTDHRKSALCNFATHQEIISRILLGQSLLKNNDIFNNDVIRASKEKQPLA